jgi:GTPase Era involved in 16S rRNA processing/NTP pyrophosphatase (non-canonical NTP hydrolase)
MSNFAPPPSESDKSRSARIDQIIAKRRPLASAVQALETQLKNLADKLRALEAYRLNLLGQVETKSDVKHRLESINISNCEIEIAAQLKILEKLRHRLDRSTLNIGVVGRMRQGKSTLLQKLSGLTDVEIPTQKGGACTAARSIIYHHESEAEAFVTFHSKRSLLEEVIHEYWKEFEWDNPPISLEAFAQTPLPPEPTTAVGQGMYIHLKEYKDHLGEYSKFLKQNSPEEEQVPADKIASYVTQQRDEQDRLITYDHLAVKQAKIYCCFAQSDIGQIALVDVPGLGDTKLGDEVLLLNTLAQEVDVVLFVRRPDPLGDQWKKDEDSGLYDRANQELKQLSQKAFMVLNHTASETDNLEDCERFKRTIPFKVVSIVIADCFNSEAANQQVLNPILNYLSDPDHLFRLDKENRNLILQEAIKRVQEQAKVELEKAQLIFGESGADEAWSERVDELFDELWENLSIGLQGKLQAVESRRYEPDASLASQIEKTFEACRKDTGIPDLETIQRTLSKQKKAPQSVYEQFINEIRLHLSQKFISVDQGLRQSLDQVKQEIAEVLASEGCLAGLTQAQGTEFLEEITQQIPEDLTKLKGVFTTFSDFNLLYRGMIQHRIRPLLDALTPGTQECPQISKVPTAEEILEVLDTVQSRTVYQSEQALQGLLNEPSQAVFAIAEEFVDGVLWSRDVKRQWKFFLQRNRSKIWSDEFNPTLTEIQRDWQRLVDRATDANQLNIDSFLY